MTRPALPLIGQTAWGQPLINAMTDLQTTADAHESELDGRLSDSSLNGRYVVKVTASGDITGVTDTAAIQANENAGLSTALVGGQTYYVAGLVKKAACSIFLNGATLKLPNGANTDLIVSDGYTDSFGTAGIADFGIYGPGEIDGNKANQSGFPTVTSANFNMAPNFTMTVSNSSLLPATGTATLNTQSGPSLFSWTANDTSSNTLTCTSNSTVRVRTGAMVVTQGHGLRIYGRNYVLRDFRVHSCAGDGVYTGWGSGNAGPGTSEIESTIDRVKSYENARNGFSLLGPHDSNIDKCWAFRNGEVGFVTGGGSIWYFNLCHAWGSPQVTSFDDHTSSKFTNCQGEMTSASGSRSWVLWTSGAILNGCYVLNGGAGATGGGVGIEIQNNASGCNIDAQFTGAFNVGLVEFTSSGGGNSVRGTATGGGASAMVAGTPAASDVIDLIPGSGTTTARYTKGNTVTFGPKDNGLAGWAFDPAVAASQTAPPSGAIKYVAVKAVDTRMVSNLYLGVGVAGATLTAGSCLVGLYDVNGNQLAVSGDQSTAWTTAGAKAAAVTPTQVVAGNTYYIGFLAVGTTTPGFARGYSQNSAIPNAGISAAPYRFTGGATGQTTLPATFTPSSLGPDVSFWAGMG